MQWQEDEYCEAKSEIDQLAKVLVPWLVLNIKSHLIVGPCPTPPIIPHSPITPLSAGFETAILDVLNEYSSSSLARHIFLFNFKDISLT